MKLIVFAVAAGIMLAVSLVTLILYFVDKKRAKQKQWRIPEAVLLGLGVAGGAVGGLLGMNLARHKTKHWYFWAVNVAALCVHVGALAAILILVQ